jgi:hypothetical protein
VGFHVNPQQCGDSFVSVVGLLGLASSITCIQQADSSGFQTGQAGRQDRQAAGQAQAQAGTFRQSSKGVRYRWQGRQAHAGTGSQAGIGGRADRHMKAGTSRQPGRRRWQGS